MNRVIREFILAKIKKWTKRNFIAIFPNCRIRFVLARMKKWWYFPRLYVLYTRFIVSLISLFLVDRAGTPGALVKDGVEGAPNSWRRLCLIVWGLIVGWYWAGVLWRHVRTWVEAGWSSRNNRHLRTRFIALGLNLLLWALGRNLLLRALGRDLLQRALGRNLLLRALGRSLLLRARRLHSIIMVGGHRGIRASVPGGDWVRALVPLVNNLK